MAMDSEQLDALLNSTLDDFDEDAPVPEPDTQASIDFSRFDDGKSCEDQILACVQALQSKFGADENFDRICSLVDEIRIQKSSSAQSRPSDKDQSVKNTADKAKQDSAHVERKPVLKKGFFNSSNASSKPATPTKKGKRSQEKSPEKPAQDGKSVEASVDEALASLLKNAENLNDMPAGLPQSEEDAKKMIDELMAQMGAGGGMPSPGGGAGADVSPDMMSQMMEPMMESLFSKDILYPSLKEVSEQYPKWLKENQPKLDAAAYGQYESQYAKMQEMCGVYEDSGMDTKAQVKRVLGLMEEMSSFGSPPESIMKSLGVELGADGMPKMPSIPGMPGGGANCSIM
eukprot:m.1341635 g.1341635  ORF g.1341635 m.1341635 type:complete len:344 (+) comp24896_c0_seq1:68-1099(+)